ncbi:MAG: type II toxin-antitoxin system RelE/ParE family toxin [Candidatus Sulfotelmatobacter sp.]
MRLRWTTPATDDLYNIVQRIQQDKPDAASDVAQTIYDGCSSLENFPHLGRKGRIAGTRDLVFSGLPYIVVYRVVDQVIEIVRIYHGAQDWP